VKHELSKYNLGGHAWRRPLHVRTLLVPGQVEDDASIRLGAIGAVARNAELLAAVRREHPDAHIVYKPHPDVVAGLRRGGHEDAAQWADEVVTHADIHRLLSQVDGVHVMTSLTGFEALMRGVPVTCHGMPFYAGWGLTDDRVGLPRRTRSLTLDQLVVGALLEYPLYLHPQRRTRATAEDVVAALAQQAARPRRWSRSIATVLMRLASPR
jgi:capsular polysaccharide export protein